MATAYFVGQERPLSDLAKWRRALIRFVYFVVGWNSGNQIEGQAIVTNYERALEMADKPGWFVVELPVDGCLPDEPCEFGAHTFPLSDARKRYESEKRPLRAVQTGDLATLQKSIKNLTKKAASA